MAQTPDTSSIGLLPADWPAPPGIVALVTTRHGGISVPPYDGFNLASHVGDDPADVNANRRRLEASLDLASPIAWLDQVHGTAVVRAGPEADGARADACWSELPGIACAVLTADCLPVLLCARDSSCVAAAHAGWRGLAAGVLESVVHALPVPAERLVAWLGPAIGPSAFEVGPEVRDAFGAAVAKGERAVVDGCFAPSPTRPGHYLADLYALARLRLAALGVPEVYGGGACTYTETGRFFSYRRDGATGRMASLICIKPGA